MSDLLRLFQTLNDGQLAQRIQGACVKYAHQLDGQDNIDPIDTEFARLVLADPFRMWHDQQLEAAANPTILANVVVREGGETVDSTAVPDMDIEYLVQSTWHKIAAKHVVLPEPEPVPEIIEDEVEGDEIPGDGEG